MLLGISGVIWGDLRTFWERFSDSIMQNHSVLKTFYQIRKRVQPYTFAFCASLSHPHIIKGLEMVKTRAKGSKLTRYLLNPVCFWPMRDFHSILCVVCYLCFVCVLKVEYLSYSFCLQLNIEVSPCGRVDRAHERDHHKRFRRLTSQQIENMQNLVHHSTGLIHNSHALPSPLYLRSPPLHKVYELHWVLCQV